MLANPVLAQALIGAEASNSAATVKYAAPTADEAQVQAAIDAEVGRLHAKLSVMLSHIEGHYESQVANLKLKLVAGKWYVAVIQNTIAAAIGFALGHFIR